MLSLRVWMPGPMFLLRGSLSLVSCSFWDGSLSRKGLPVETPLELEKRAVYIPLECFLAMRKFEGLRFGCIYSSSERLDFFQWLPESARYDMARGQVDKAYATLERIARDNGKPMPLGRLVDQTHTSYTPVRPAPRCSPFTFKAIEFSKSFLRFLNCHQGPCFPGLVSLPL